MNKNTTIIVAVGLLVLGVCVCSAILVTASVLMAGNSLASLPTSSAAVAGIADPGSPTVGAIGDRPGPSPSPTTAPEITPSPAATLEPRQALRANIIAILGTGNRDLPRFTELKFDDPEPGAIFVHWAINDNLTEGLIIFGAKHDAAKILQAVHESGLDYTYALLSGSFPLVDAYGQSEEKNVVNLTFYKPTVERIVWENFNNDNIYLIADQAFVHTLFHGDWQPSPAP